MRQTKAVKEKEEVRVLSQAPVEAMPEEAGTMTQAAANAVAEPQMKHPAKAFARQTGKGEAVQYFRVTAERRIMGATGFRAKLHAGKVVNTTTYNISKLRSQGVPLQEITEEEALAG
jgi:hypothetical protein